MRVSATQTGWKNVEYGGCWTFQNMPHMSHSPYFIAFLSLVWVWSNSSYKCSMFCVNSKLVQNISISLTLHESRSFQPGWCKCKYLKKSFTVFAWQHWEGSGKWGVGMNTRLSLASFVPVRYIMIASPQHFNLQRICHDTLIRSLRQMCSEIKQLRLRTSTPIYC